METSYLRLLIPSHEQSNILINIILDERRKTIRSDVLVSSRLYTDGLYLCSVVKCWKQRCTAIDRSTICSSWTNERATDRTVDLRSLVGGGWMNLFRMDLSKEMFAVYCRVLWLAIWTLISSSLPFPQCLLPSCCCCRVINDDRLSIDLSGFIVSFCMAVAMRNNIPGGVLQKVKANLFIIVDRWSLPYIHVLVVIEWINWSWGSDNTINIVSRN